jgi:adapter protein MecA 1/2
MEMERINDDTIRVMIENEDLQDRGITVMDLLGNQERIESFFYSILEEVDEEHDFEDNEQVTFQILPNRNGLELFISKAEPSEQLGNLLQHLSDSQKSDDEKIDGHVKNALGRTDGDDVVETTDHSHNKHVPKTSEFVLKFKTFEALLDLANEQVLHEFVQQVYRYQHAYFAYVNFDDMQSEERVKDYLAIALEYSQRSNLSIDVLHEHGEQLFDNQPLEMIQRLFFNQP